MPNNILLSQTEEMYLVTIRKLCEFCENKPIPIPEIAQELGVQPVSVSQMINKLAEGGFVNYLPYKGVVLTETGLEISTRVLRHRRLWEVFLVKILNVDLDEADKLACHFEHVTPPDIGNRLADFLNNPLVCFHGEPIPMNNGERVIFPEGLFLESLKVGQTGQVIRINADSTSTNFLFNEGIHPGAIIKLLAIGNNGERLLESNEKHLHIDGGLTKSIIIGNINQTIHSRRENQMTSISLSNLTVGQKGVIQRLNFKGAIRQRLMAMGLVAGEIVTIKRIAPLGDPIDFVIKGYDLSLRKSEAKDVLVTLITEE